METIYEVVRIKQVVREVQDELVQENIKSPQDLADIAHYFIGDEDREVFLVLCLNTKLEVTAVHRCHIGTVNSCIVSPREVFRTVLLNQCSSLAIVHNHPSSANISNQPSQEDIQLTRKLVSASQYIDIDIVDHLIVTPNKDNYYSFKENHMM